MKIIIILAAILSSPVFGANYFTLAEISKHSSVKDCWLIVNSKVYDVSSYISKHPAPESVMIKYCGKNADIGWNTKDKNKPHSRSATKMLERFFVGDFRK